MFVKTTNAITGIRNAGCGECPACHLLKKASKISSRKRMFCTERNQKETGGGLQSSPYNMLLRVYFDAAASL